MLNFGGVYHWNLSWVDIRITFQITIDLYTGHRTEICWVLLKVASWVTCHTFIGTGCQRNIPQHRHLYLTSLVSRMPRSCGRELHAVLGSSNSRVGSAQVQTPQLTTEWSLCSWSGCQHVFLQHVGHGGNHWHDGLSSGETIDSRIGADIEAAFLTARKRHRSAAWLTCLPDAEKNHCDSKLQNPRESQIKKPAKTAPQRVSLFEPDTNRTPKIWAMRRLLKISIVESPELQDARKFQSTSEALHTESHQSGTSHFTRKRWIFPQHTWDFDVRAKTLRIRQCHWNFKWEDLWSGQNSKF